MKPTSTCIMVHLGDDDPRIDCWTAPSPSDPGDLGFFPCLQIGPARVIPDRGRGAAQLLAIRDAIDAWLATPDGQRLVQAATTPDRLSRAPLA